MMMMMILRMDVINGPKRVELIERINKPKFLHLVGCLYWRIAAARLLTGLFMSTNVYKIIRISLFQWQNTRNSLLILLLLPPPRPAASSSSASSSSSHSSSLCQVLGLSGGPG
jgi:hypothetical protein